MITVLFNMPRQRKVPLIKGEKRLKDTKDGMVIVQTLFCGECGKRTISAAIQRNSKIAKRDNLPRYKEVARVCMNVDKHKDRQKYFWPIKDVYIPSY